MFLGAHLQLLRDRPALIAFGFVMALASCFGQTWFIGLFGPGIRAELGLSHTAWGTVYLGGTLGSAALLPFTGRLLDRVALRPYALAVCGLMGAACATIAFAPGIAGLVLAVFLLRHAGQGLMSHVALISMARYFDASRGRAIALAALGFRLSETLLPVAVVAAIAAHGWRATYAVAALLVLCALAPGVWRLLAHHEASHRAYLARAVPEIARTRGVASWSRRQVLASPAFYLIIVATLTPSLIVTALFFHHLTIADLKGWSHTWITGSYALFALAAIVGSLLAGTAVDRFGATRVARSMLVPLAASLLVLAVGDDALVVLPYLALMGLSSGTVSVVGAALWAELYGTLHLGAIRSLAASISVLASALGPVSMGIMMDHALSATSICAVFIALTVLATGCVIAGLTRHRTESHGG